MDFFEELDALYGKGDRNALEEYLENGLAKARRDGDGDMEVAILNEMGGFYRGVSEYSLAEDYFDEAMQLMRRRGQAGTYGYAVALMNRAGNARMSGDPYHAAALFLEAREILARDRDKSDYAYVSLLNNLALTYQDLGRYPFTELSPCGICGAPERPESVEAWNSAIDQARMELLTGTPAGSGTSPAVNP